MKCTDAERYLDDFVDNALPGRIKAELEAHIASCPSCRAAERGLRAILAEAGALEGSVEPPRDLWPGIARAIAAEPVFQARAESRSRGAPGRRILPLLAAAAALVIGILGSLTLASGMGTKQSAFEYKPRRVPASFTASPGLAESQAAFEAARAELYAALESRRASLPAGTARVIERNLRIIDKAAGEIESALEKDPENKELSSFLISTYESEIRMLRQAALQPGGI